MFVTHPRYIRDKAIQLRVERNMTLDEIAERLALPKTTVYYWINHIRIPQTQKQTLARKKASRATSRKYKRLRDEAYAEGVATWDRYRRDVTFRDFLILFMTEGHRRSINGVSIANSDPDIVLMADRWIRLLTSRKVEYSVQHHADQSVDELRQFWGKLLGINPDAVKMVRKSNSGQLRSRIWRCRYGVMSVRTSDTYFRARLQAWTDLLRAEWAAVDAITLDAFGA